MTLRRMYWKGKQQHTNINAYRQDHLLKSLKFYCHGNFDYQSCILFTRKEIKKNVVCHPHNVVYCLTLPCSEFIVSYLLCVLDTYLSAVALNIKLLQKRLSNLIKLLNQNNQSLPLLYLNRTKHIKGIHENSL